LQGSFTGIGAVEKHGDGVLRLTATDRCAKIFT
jgi:hypothetical protein